MQNLNGGGDKSINQSIKWWRKKGKKKGNRKRKNGLYLGHLKR